MEVDFSHLCVPTVNEEGEILTVRIGTHHYATRSSHYHATFSAVEEIQKTFSMKTLLILAATFTAGRLESL